MTPEKPRIAGELPFRVTSGNDPSLFESGSDLLRPDGHPCSRPLYFLYILCMKNLGKIDLLRTMVRILVAFPSRRCVYRPTSHALYTLNVTFIVDFSRSTTIFFVIAEQGVNRLPFDKLFLDWRLKWDARPYTGAHI